MKISSINLLLFLLVITPALSQENEEEEQTKHKVVLLLGFTHIPETIEEGEPLKSEEVPTIGVDYFYKFHPKWQIGVVVDVELGKYAVDFGGENIPRENAVVTGVVAGYTLLKGWSVYAGPGIEFESNRNLFIFRAATEYEFELGKNWGLSPGFSYDFKKEYSTFALGVGISRSF
jgi:hypothetical protein